MNLMDDNQTEKDMNKVNSGVECCLISSGMCDRIIKKKLHEIRWVFCCNIYGRATHINFEI